MLVNTLDHDYLALVSDILNNGREKQTRNGTTLSVFGKQIKHSMKSGFPLITTKKMAWKQIVTELYWFLRGDTSIDFLLENDCHIWDNDMYRVYLNHIKHELWQYEQENIIGTKSILSKEQLIGFIKTNKKFSNLVGTFGPIYGEQWRNFSNSVDQITDVINLLFDDPDSRRILVSAWDPSVLELQELPPCHYAFQFYTRELTIQERVNIYASGQDICGDHSFFDNCNVPARAISLMWNQRSVDVPLGLPFNIASYGLLLEIVAKMVNMIPEDLIGNLGDCHIYTNQIDSVETQISRAPYQLPILAFPEVDLEYERSIDELINKISIDDYKIINYNSHASIKIPLS
jgi:thymidylate synthase